MKSDSESLLPFRPLARLWVEALSFESLEPSRGARASTYTGRNYDLIYQGTGFADRSQSVPVHFAVTGDTAGLRAGQFLTVITGLLRLDESTLPDQPRP